MIAAAQVSHAMLSGLRDIQTTRADKSSGQQQIRTVIQQESFTHARPDGVHKQSARARPGLALLEQHNHSKCFFEVVV